MNRVRKILVATDRSVHARRAELRAAMLGDELKVDAMEAMAVQHARAAQNAPAALPAIAVALQGEGRALVEVPTTAPAHIARHAQEVGADLTVVAATRENFFAGFIARFKNDELIRRSDRPVLLVHREPETAYRKVLVGVDFSAASRQAAQAALAVAPSAQITFLHAFRVNNEEMMLQYDVPPDIVHGFRVRAREAARMKLNSFIDALGPRKQLISRAIEHGMPAPVIRAHAKQVGADLIVVGKHSKSRLVDLVLGSVTQRLMEYGDCDLLVTPPLSEEEPELPPAA